MCLHSGVLVPSTVNMGKGEQLSRQQPRHSGFISGELLLKLLSVPGSLIMVTGASS